MIGNKHPMQSLIFRFLTVGAIYTTFGRIERLPEAHEDAVEA